MTGESGLNMNELHLADRAAGRVADEFRKAIPQLKDLRDWLMGLDTDMGMGACREGETWNVLMAQVVQGPEGSMVAAIDALIERVTQMAQWGDTAQKEYDQTEHRNAESYPKLDPRGAYPPIPA
ncbi:hypothetical protein [Mycobacteroides abscessus]|uniref:hypothetical protein n=1 Tax=Mycobacteroides abscessus TaxID=36809 RepID=UPI00092816BF|nr:hypothetical protein [Mycobacteroides abscessus]MDO3332802.1 hypothetical protein [Mycobacteroides abscessus subsp. bolletii]QSM90568.1 hypothetical protein I3U44_07850 [Mycobacteroides abscessus subsp. bolletii]SHZ54525.1 Uncharacterised protein [Mycobacteroides abscessus subsp. bolletii]SIA10914.1 Uncharacterised protein [Mycobacteroides abscessus subsp. bolletii]SKT06418.1 Uncharacterised protein [Mycobacteroides abscessus subsp. bolletii]